MEFSRLDKSANTRLNQICMFFILLFSEKIDQKQVEIDNYRKTGHQYFE